MSYKHIYYKASHHTRPQQAKENLACLLDTFLLKEGNLFLLFFVVVKHNNIILYITQ